MNLRSSGEQIHTKPNLAGILLKWTSVNGAVTLALAASLFIAAGALDWGMGWAYIGLVVASLVATAIILIPDNPELLAERSWIHKDSKKWDKVIAFFSGLPGTIGTGIVAGLDVRFGWSPPTPLALQVGALGIATLGFTLYLWALASNRFFSAYVRIQTERGHTVATGGPYQYVRHPGYAGGILVYLTTPIVLGSLWAFIPAALSIAGSLIRTSLEDRTLQDELAGYADYARQVRYRMLPGIW